MKQMTFALCDNLRQTNNVLEVIKKSKLDIDVEILGVCYSGQRWIMIRCEENADLLMLGIILGRETDLYKY